MFLNPLALLRTKFAFWFPPFSNRIRTEDSCPSAQKIRACPCFRVMYRMCYTYSTYVLYIQLSFPCHVPYVLYIQYICAIHTVHTVHMCYTYSTYSTWVLYTQYIQYSAIIVKLISKIILDWGHVEYFHSILTTPFC